jgi:hypothetical protein
MGVLERTNHKSECSGSKSHFHLHYGNIRSFEDTHLIELAYRSGKEKETMDNSPSHNTFFEQIFRSCSLMDSCLKVQQS